ncbi:hypothetical protein [Aestuariicoccus sp. MJ-SS9]|uniref:hypothetical protein n=1 Tax=Aestuariicoccus sp. MJ-SS9 TaxID=3079855 RepID=UPI00290968B8|nr:hypothetical protein [Aestuariicoccus sp. MJ-SS9]MDU8914170.1 hypothetical protein [Aestuariicoccus sp. MJ-SS9]
MKLFKTSPPLPRFKRFKLLVSGLAVLAGTATVGHAESVYPQVVRSLQTTSMVRPYTGLELSAKMKPVECGTLTLTEVAQRYFAITSDDSHD